MKKTITLIVVAAVIAITGLSFGPTANAVSTVTAARCTVANARLEIRTTKVAAATTAQTNAYNKVETKVDALLTNALKAKSFDPTALDGSNALLKTKITVYTTAAAKYSTDLSATKDLSCGDSDGAFATSLATTRTDLTALRAASLDVRTAIKNNVIPALNDYVTYLKAQEATTTTTTTSTGGTK